MRGGKSTDDPRLGMFGGFIGLEFERVGLSEFLPSLLPAQQVAANNQHIRAPLSGGA